MQVMKGTDKILNYVLEFSEKMKGFVPQTWFSQFFCDSFFLIETKFKNAAFLKQSLLFSETLKLEDNIDEEIITKKNAEVLEFSKQLEEFLPKRILCKSSRSRE